MKKKLIVVFFVFFWNMPSYGEIYLQKTYSRNGIDCNMRMTKTVSATKGSGVATATTECFDSDGKQVARVSQDVNSITYDASGNVIAQYLHYTPRVTFVLNEKGQIIQKTNGMQGAVVNTFEYTDTGKMLVYDKDGNFQGAYEDILAFHSMAPSDTATSKNDRIKNVIGDLNLISEDGNFYDYDEKGKLKGVYSLNGEQKKYQYQANGDYTLYDKDGNNLGRFMANGQKRRIYTVDEAIPIVTQGAKNTFSIRYR